MADSGSQKDVLVATIGRPHGVRGLVNLFAATDDPASVEDFGLLHDEEGSVWRVEWRGRGVAQLFDALERAVADRNEASLLVNRKLYAARHQLPEPEADEFYHADLIGLTAEDLRGQPLGKVSLIHDYGAGVSLEITGGKQDFIVPFTQTNVPEIDFEGSRVLVDLPDEVEVEGDLTGDVKVFL